MWSEKVSVLLNEEEISKLLVRLGVSFGHPVEHIEYLEALWTSAKGEWFCQFNENVNEELHEHPFMRFRLQTSTEMWLGWNNFEDQEALKDVVEIITPALRRLNVSDLVLFNSVDAALAEKLHGRVEHGQSSHFQFKRDAIVIRFV